jgi:hypothetical protein
MPWIEFPAGRFETSRPGPIKMPPGTFHFHGAVYTSEDCLIEGATVGTLENNPVDLIETLPCDHNTPALTTE